MRRSAVAALCLVAVLVCLAAFWGAGRARRPPVSTGQGIATIEFLDVGQGDSILIRSPEGKTALVDAGPSNRVVEILRGRGIRSLDLVVVSHHHQDHYGGMAAVIRAFQPRVFLDADSPHVTPNYLAVLRAVEKAKATAIRAGPSSRTIELGSVKLIVFPQGPVDAHNENNNSVGLRVEYGQFAALLTGDSEVRERRWWSREVPGLCERVDVLKLAHHGSRNGTDAAWLALVRPGLAVASLGAGNGFGHPHPEVVALLRSLGIPLMRTDEAGSILVRTDGRAFRLEGSAFPSFAVSSQSTKKAGGRRWPPASGSSSKRGRLDQYWSAETISPVLSVTRARRMATFVDSLRNRTLPSPKRQLAPPGW
jgi:competence protein ComEC